jgi:hypothetical protein
MADTKRNNVTYEQAALVRGNLRVALKSQRKTLGQFLRTFPSRLEANRVKQRLHHCMRPVKPRRFRMSDLEALAQWLGVGVGEFFWDRELDPLVWYEPLLRPLDSAGKEQVKKAEQAALAFKQASQERGLRRWPWPQRALSNREHKSVYRRSGKSMKARHVARANVQARNVRVAWSLGVDPLPELRWLAHCAGIAIVDAKLAPARKVSAAAGVVGRQRFIAVTPSFSQLSVVEQREQLAFQLGRLVLGDRSPEGAEAVYFCRVFLLPDEAEGFLVRAKEDGQLRGLAKDAFGVTDALLEERLNDWGFGSSPRWQDMKIDPLLLKRLLKH